MRKYYYLVASLPGLTLGESPPLSVEAFLDECRKWLDARDLKALSDAERGQTDRTRDDVPAVRRWKEFDAGLRVALAAQRRGSSQDKSGKPAAKAVARIFEEKDPLKREYALESARWDMLSGMELEYFFDINRLAIYYIKLQTVSRLGEFDKDKGEKVFHELCEVTYDRTEG